MSKWKTRSALVAGFVVFCPWTLPAESEFYRPYFHRDEARFTAPKDILTEAVAGSDVIFIGRSSQIDQGHYDDIHGGGTYQGLVQVDRLLSGSMIEPAVVLIWKTSATNIKEDAQHIFFLQRTAVGYCVNKEIYVFDGMNYSRTYGYYDGGFVSTFETLALPLHPMRRPNAAMLAALRADLESNGGQRQETALLLMSETHRKEFIPLLKYALVHDRGGYLNAIYPLCRIDGEQGAAAGFEYLRQHRNLGRWEEAAVFDAIVAAGNRTAVAALLALGNRDIRFRVSAAFAIKDLSPSDLSAIIPWIAARWWNFRERIVELGSSDLIPMSELLTAALTGDRQVEFAHLWEADELEVSQ